MTTIKAKLYTYYALALGTAGAILHGAVHLICGWLGIQCPL